MNKSKPIGPDASGRISTGADPEAVIIGQLVDLRMVCDALELDFARLDRQAYREYVAAVSGTMAEDANREGKNVNRTQQ